MAWPQDLGGSAGVALGGAPLGNLYAPVDDGIAQQTIDHAWALGVRCFDTAPHYGQGLSEHRFGQALRQRPRDSYLLSTKVGRLLRPDPQAPVRQFGYVRALPFSTRFDYGFEATLRSIEDSLQRLGLARVDIAYIHDIDRRTHGQAQPQRFREAMDGAYRALEQLRSQRLLRAIGLGVNETEVCEAALQHGDFDCFMLAGRYTLLDQSAQERLIPACVARGVRLVLAGAYNSGILASGAVPGAHYDYQPADAGVLARVAQIERVCETFGVPLRAAALQFGMGCASVAGVVVGARTAAEIDDSVAMARHPIPPAFWDALRAGGLVNSPPPPSPA
jgi:D-threo-aldose 1-dehydrogenase